MVTLPMQFIQLPRFPGYYWNTQTDSLWSCKVNGVLKPLKKHKGFTGYGLNIAPGYRVSIDGHQKSLDHHKLVQYVATVRESQPIQIFPTQNV